MGDRENYKKRLEQEEIQNKKNRLKRENKKKAKDLQVQLYLESQKDHSTGLIIWKKSKNSSSWDGYIKNKKTFKLSFGIYKCSLSLYKGIEVSEENKKDKAIKTSFNAEELKVQAEAIAKRFSSKEKINNKI